MFHVPASISETLKDKILRVRRTILELLMTFAKKCKQEENFLLLPLIDPFVKYILLDYQTAPSKETRESDVLSFLTILIDKLGERFHPWVGLVFSSTFEVTLSMISQDREEYPDYPVKFFDMLRAILGVSFTVVLDMSETQLKLFMDSIIWAVKHRNKNVAELGLKLLINLFQEFTKHRKAEAEFYRYSVYFKFYHYIF